MVQAYLPEFEFDDFADKFWNLFILSPTDLEEGALESTEIPKASKLEPEPTPPKREKDPDLVSAQTLPVQYKVRDGESQCI